MADTRTSPLARLADRLADANDRQASIRIAEAPCLTQLALRVAPGTAAAAAAGRALDTPLPTAPGTAHAGAGVEVLWMGPDEWLVVAPDGAAARLTHALEQALAGAHATAVDVSAQRTAVELAGDRARDVLRKGCALDLHPRAFAAGRCAQTLLARAGVILHQRTDEPSYRVFVRASFAEYLAEWLLDAAAEYRGVAPVDLTPRSVEAAGAPA
jgi:sarcosine oxidase subunit gamma